jgi:hypothetical protein
MSKTISLSASARYGYGGKQYIARITGRDSKFTFSREFVGRKGGKRNESAEYTTDESGLYMTCDIDSKGRKDETFYVVERQNDALVKEAITLEDAMDLAKRLDQGQSFEEAVLSMWPPQSASEAVVNPLAQYTDEQIQAEFVRRGLS